MNVIVRPATPKDLDEIVALCEEHAAFEKSSLSADRVRRSLGRFLFVNSPRAWCLVAEVEGKLAGYATYSLEFSTWNASEFLSMDCLYVREGNRNAGIGMQLLQRIRRAAVALGREFVEWQTPSWNAGAIRFYDRIGAVGQLKIRYRWPAG